MFARRSLAEALDRQSQGFGEVSTTSRRWFRAARELEALGQAELARLRDLPMDRLAELREPTRRVQIAMREATLATIVEDLGGGTVKVVIQAFLPTSMPFLGKHVFVNGFRKARNGEITDLGAEELYDYD